MYISLLYFWIFYLLNIFNIILNYKKYHVMLGYLLVHLNIYVYTIFFSLWKLFYISTNLGKRPVEIKSLIYWGHLFSSGTSWLSHREWVIKKLDLSNRFVQFVLMHVVGLPYLLNSFFLGMEWWQGRALSTIIIPIKR